MKYAVYSEDEEQFICNEDGCDLFLTKAEIEEAIKFFNKEYGIVDGGEYTLYEKQGNIEVEVETKIKITSP